MLQTYAILTATAHLFISCAQYIKESAMQIIIYLFDKHPYQVPTLPAWLLFFIEGWWSVEEERKSLELSGQPHPRVYRDHIPLPSHSCQSQNSQISWSSVFVSSVFPSDWGLGRRKTKQKANFKHLLTWLNKINYIFIYKNVCAKQLYKVLYGWKQYNR